MDPIAVLLDLQGYLTRAEARGCGYADREIDARVRTGEWTRIRRGYYVPTATWRSLTPEEKHLVLCRAVLHSLGDAVLLSHVSAALAHGLELWGVDLSRVHVTRLDKGAGRLEGDVVHHEGTVRADEEIHLDNGLRAVPMLRAVIEAASRTSNEAAVVLLDSALRLGGFTKQELEETFRSMARWPFMQHLHVPVLMADAASQSVGESRGKVFFRVHRLPTPCLQYEVFDRQGLLRGTTDWAWPELRTMGEFDGRVKYGRLLKAGDTSEGVVHKEKVREDLLREITDFSMIRFTWEDWDRPQATAARVRRKLARRTG